MACELIGSCGACSVLSRAQKHDCSLRYVPYARRCGRSIVARFRQRPAEDCVLVRGAQQLGVGHRCGLHRAGSGRSVWIRVSIDRGSLAHTICVMRQSVGEGARTCWNMRCGIAPPHPPNKLCSKVGLDQAYRETVVVNECVVNRCFRHGAALLIPCARKYY